MEPQERVGTEAQAQKASLETRDYSGSSSWRVLSLKNLDSLSVDFILLQTHELNERIESELETKSSFYNSSNWREDLVSV